jgi:hypothetical protein
VRVVSLFDDLHEALAATRVDAALALAPMGPEERQGLAAALAGLPSGQLEAALSLVVPRVAPHLANALPDVSGGLRGVAGWEAGGGRWVGRGGGGGA